MTVLLLLAGPALAASKKPANVKLTAEGVTAVFTFEKGPKLKVTTKGSPLKAGTYWTKSLTIYKKDDKERVWELRGTTRFGSVKVVMVNPEQEKILFMGPPIHLVVNATQGKGAEAQIMRFSLAAVGRSSEGYYPGAYLDGKKPPLPTFKITDADGKTLAAGRFSMTDGRCGYDWHIPKGFKEHFNVDVKAVMGPFRWALKKTGPLAVE